MLKFAASCLLMALSLSVAGCSVFEAPAPVQSQSSAEVTEFHTRLDAATSMSDPVRRDDALSQVARDAAKRGRVDIVKRALGLIASPVTRDSAASDSALSLSSVSTGDGAVSVAKSITDPVMRDDVLSKIAKGQGRGNR